MSSEKIKVKRKADLRKKNLGLGIGKIDVDKETNNSKTNKVLFDDDFVASDYDSDENDDRAQHADSENSQDDDDSSDDEVEQVSASAAKQQAMEMFAAERKTRKEESAVSSKRKRKAKEVPKPKQPKPESEDEDDFDEDFFAMVDEERKNETKAKKTKTDVAKNTLGRHTTFVSEVDDPTVPGSISAPIAADHNIEVVVLPNLSSEDGAGDDDKAVNDKQLLSLSAGLGTQPSEAALLFCRGSRARSDEAPEKGFERKRSRKMKYGLSSGQPSRNFAEHSKKRR
mmetsp:Transcript_701/g.1117  ORF Transcript_701/g.1117 Transcript_701/m.1117 type:complete len:284 (-) Transcript_701:34-885(-)